MPCCMLVSLMRGGEGKGGASECKEASMSRPKSGEFRAPGSNRCWRNEQEAVVECIGELDRGWRRSIGAEGGDDI